MFLLIIFMVFFICVSDQSKNGCQPHRLIYPNEDCDVDESLYQSLSFETLSKLPKLVNIYLMGIVKFMEPGCFSGMNNLHSVTVQDGPLMRIRESVFTNLKLNRLILRHNRISQIDDYAFARMPNLYSLDLSDNLIEYIEKSWFEGSSIPHLYLTGNRITNLYSDTFSMLTLGRKLFLGRNNIASIENGTFDKFKSVDLSSNRLSEVNFLYDAKLEVLLLGANKIEYIKFNRHTEINQMDIIPNPWICDCLLKFWKNADNTKWYKSSYPSKSVPICNATIKRCPYL